MSFLNLWVAAGLAAAVIPALVLLYFLKLRRREQAVASTLLWRRSVEDLQVNAPFQRLRRNLLLLLQLLILLAALFALARPLIQTDAAEEDRLVLLIDRSASMQTEEADGTRLELAKEQAVRLVKTLNRTGSAWFSFAGAQANTEVMVIAFADRANVIAPFTANTAELVETIRAIQPTDAATRLEEALTLAQAYLAQTTVEMSPDFTKSGSKIVLYSDGRIADLGQLSLRYGEIELVPIGESRDNVALTALQARRNPERPTEVNVLIQAQNFAAEPVRSDVSLFVDGRLHSAKAVSFAPGRSVVELAPADGAAEPDPALAPLAPDSGLAPEGSRVTFGIPQPPQPPLVMPAAGLLEARVARRDALVSDNHAYALVPPPRKLRVLLVSENNPFIEFALAGMPLERVRKVTPAEYEDLPADEVALSGQSIYDVVILDRHTTERLPVGNYLFLGAVPQLEGVSLTESHAHVDVPWYDTLHPILRYVALEYVYIAEAPALEVPEAAEILAESEFGPVIARYARDGRQFILLSFDVRASTLVRRASFAAFMYNAVNFLGGAATIGSSGRAPGETVQIPLPADVERSTITLPDGSTMPLKPNAAGVAHFGATRQVGLYTIEPALPGQERFAVNLLDPLESDIAPSTRLKLGTREIQTGDVIATATPEIWRWFAGAALAILLLEWYVYNRRVAL